MSTLSVLVVDDELGMRLGVERTLRNFNFPLPEFDDNVHFSIEMAGTGKEAFQILDQNRTDIVILDYKLPDTQGLEILVKLMEEKKDLLTIMVTAYASLEVAISATKNGAFDFLAKPFTPEELRNTIKKAAKHIYVTRKARKLEEEKRQVRFQFISVLAHELKSPLAAVENYLVMMKDRVIGDELVKYDNMIDRSLIRIDGMRKMIFDLLDLTKIESGQKQRNLTNVNIISSAKFAIEGVLLNAKERNITINLDCKDDVIELLADSSELDIVFNNIVSNAVKYNKDNGQINLGISKENDFIKIVCKDTGIGMSKEDLEKLFGEFVRIKNAQTKNIMGSGLGLSILKKIVKLYNGEINVESEVDIGTTFTLTLSTLSS